MKCRRHAVKCYEWVISVIWSKLPECWKPHSLQLVHKVMTRLFPLTTYQPTFHL